MAEDHGYSTVFISDHFSDRLAPLPALVMAAEHTSIKVGTLVLANDFRHPAVLAKEAATVDLLTEGRLELGMGTGWEQGDYASSGIERPPPSVQVDRFEEAVTILKGLWAPGEFRFDGSHYSVRLEGLPNPGGGRPDLIIGAGGRRMLRIAGREADIVGISAAEIVTREDLAQGITGAGELLDDKIGWIREGAGDRFDSLELNVLTFGIAVGDRAEGADRLARRWGSDAAGILSSPHFLAGSVDDISDDLMARRERWGINYPVIPHQHTQELAPVVARLTGS